MLSSKLDHLITYGRLTVRLPRETISVGKIDPRHPESRLDVVIRIKNRATALKLALNPDLYLGEAYMDGDIEMEQGSMWDLLALVGFNIAQRPPGETAWQRLATRGLSVILHRNSLRASRRNVAHHYDLSGDMYRMFLDQDLQYSCAYFRSPDDTVDQAQIQKKQHIISKLLLKPGQRILDIGCGWGGLALSIAKAEDVRVLGVTLSKEQLAVARERARAEGLADRVSFELIDYRELEDSFDRIVSVGMFEHVGPPHYETYFSQVNRLLKPTGVALVHSIGKMHGPAPTNSFIRKYIFPGGYIPALSEVMTPVERSGLWITDLEILRLHYADTLRAWRERFLERADKLEGIYDDRFRRMWEFYLAGSEMSFRYYGFMVFQAQLSRAIDAVPVTRDYMGEAERALRLRASERAGADMRAT